MDTRTGLPVVGMIGGGQLARMTHQAAIALGQSLANVVQLALAVILLRRKIGPLGLGGAVRGVIRFVVAGVPAAIVGWLVFASLGGSAGWVAGGYVGALLGGAVIGLTTLVVYVGLLAVLRAPELGTAVRTVRRILGR